MRIAVLNWRDIRSPGAGGAEEHVWELFRRLAGRGHGIHFISYHFPRAPRLEHLGPIVVHRVGGAYNANYAIALAARRFARANRVDLIVEALNKIPFCTPLMIPRIPKIAIAYHFFGPTLYQEVPWPLAAYIHAWEATVGILYRRVPMVSISPSTSRQLVQKGIAARHIACLPVGMDLERYRPTAAKADAPLVVILSRLRRYKRVDFGLRVFARVHADLPEARLVVIGDGPERARLERLARSIGVDRAVEFVGFVQTEAKIRWLSHAWLLLNTSLIEGWGLNNLEANACGTTVVGSACPGTVDSVPEGVGLLVPPDDLEGHRDALLRLLRDGAFRERLQDNARVWAARFSWDTAAVLLEAFLENTVRSWPRVTLPGGSQSAFRLFEGFSCPDHGLPG